MLDKSGQVSFVDDVYLDSGFAAPPLVVLVAGRVCQVPADGQNKDERADAHRRRADERPARAAEHVGQQQGGRAGEHCDAGHGELQRRPRRLRRRQHRRRRARRQSARRFAAGRRQALAARRQAVAGRRQALAARRQALAARRQAVAGRRQALAARRQAVAGRRQTLAARRQAVVRRRQAIAGWRQGRRGRVAARLAAGGPGGRGHGRCAQRRGRRPLAAGNDRRRRRRRRRLDRDENL